MAYSNLCMKIHLTSNTISYKYLKDEIPDEKLFKISTAMLKWNF